MEAKIVICDNVSWSDTKQWRASEEMKKLIDDESHNIPDAMPIVVDNEACGSDERVVTQPQQTGNTNRTKRML